MQVGNDYNSLKLWDSYINFEISQKSTMKANEIFWQAIRLPIKNLMNLKLKYFLIYRINVVCRYRKFLDDFPEEEFSKSENFQKFSDEKDISSDSAQAIGEYEDNIAQTEFKGR